MDFKIITIVDVQNIVVLVFSYKIGIIITYYIRITVILENEKTGLVRWWKYIAH